jgi:hypothetical protein
VLYIVVYIALFQAKFLVVPRSHRPLLALSSLRAALPKMKLGITTILAVTLLSQAALAGPITGTLCITACNAGYATCCISAGFVAGEWTHIWSFTDYANVLGTFTLGLGSPLALIGCSAAQGACMVACAAVVATPTP